MSSTTVAAAGPQIVNCPVEVRSTVYLLMRYYNTGELTDSCLVELIRPLLFQSPQIYVRLSNNDWLIFSCSSIGRFTSLSVVSCDALLQLPMSIICYDNASSYHQGHNITRRAGTKDE